MATLVGGLEVAAGAGSQRMNVTQGADAHLAPEGNASWLRLIGTAHGTQMRGYRPCQHRGNAAGTRIVRLRPIERHPKMCTAGPALQAGMPRCFRGGYHRYQRHRHPDDHTNRVLRRRALCGFRGAPQALLGAISRSELPDRTAGADPGIRVHRDWSLGAPRPRRR